MHWLKIIIDAVFSLGLFINALLFIPQAIKLIKYKAQAARGLSLITFIGFCLTQLAAIAYGWFNQDAILMVGYLLSLLSCGLVTCLLFKYRSI